MKKILALLILSASVSMLHAQCYDSSGQYHGQPSQGQGYNGQGQGYNGQGQGYNGQGQGYNGQGQGNFYQQGQGYGPNAQGYYERGQYLPENYAPVNNSEDQMLADKVNREVHSSSKFNHVEVTVNKGYVTLHGYVATKEDRMEAEKKVRGMKEVRGVSNRIQINNSWY